MSMESFGKVEKLPSTESLWELVSLGVEEM